MVPASFTQRAIGRAIDLALLTILLGVVLAPFTEDDELDVPLPFAVALFVAVLAYEVVPVRLRGQTPGKVVVRTRVADLDSGAPPSWSRSLARWAPACVVLLLGGVYPPLSLALLAALYLSALADPKGRNVLDKLARTQVVRTGARSGEVNREAA